MYCANCGEDAKHGTGNCPHARKGRAPEKNKTIRLEKKEFEVPEGKVLIDQELFNQLMEFAARLDIEREAHTKYMREYRKRKASG